MTQRSVAPRAALSIAFFTSAAMAAEAKTGPDSAMLPDTVCTRANQPIDEKGFVQAVAGELRYLRLICSRRKTIKFTSTEIPA